MRGVAALVAVVLLGSCAALGASEITVTARNEGTEPMVVQVVDSQDQQAARPYGAEQVVPPGVAQQVTLAVPGGGWTVTVNGAFLISPSDTGARRGELPVTLVLPAAGHPVGPYWEAPSDWVEAGAEGRH